MSFDSADSEVSPPITQFLNLIGLVQVLSGAFP